MENINIKVILDEVFGKSCDSITCDTCKYKEDCELIISNTTVCEDSSSIVSLADDGGIELRNYDIVIIRFNF